MIRLANLLQAPTVSIYQLVKTKTFALYLFDMVKWIKWNEMRMLILQSNQNMEKSTSHKTNKMKNSDSNMFITVIVEVTESRTYAS